MLLFEGSQSRAQIIDLPKWRSGGFDLFDGFGIRAGRGGSYHLRFLRGAGILLNGAWGGPTSSREFRYPRGIRSMEWMIRSSDLHLGVMALTFNHDGSSQPAILGRGMVLLFPCFALGTLEEWAAFQVPDHGFLLFWSAPDQSDSFCSAGAPALILPYFFWVFSSPDKDPSFRFVFVESSRRNAWTSDRGDLWISFHIPFEVTSGDFLMRKADFLDLIFRA